MKANTTEKKTGENFLILSTWIIGGFICFYMICVGAEFKLPYLWNNILHYALRLGIIAFSLGAWFKTQAMLEARKNNENDIKDLLHIISAPANIYFQNNKKASDRLLIISSLFIDAFATFILLYSLLGPSIEPFISLLILFALRQIFQVICALPKPQGLIWHNPGFPSLLVTYEVENDFFFSGHTSIAILATIELFTINPYIGIIAGLIACFEIATVIILRAHYTMDVFTAILAAFCSTAIAHLFI